MKSTKIVHKINFTSPPKIGTVLMVEGQRYVLSKIIPHTKQDGTVTNLLEWHSHCAQCGIEFTAKTSFTAKGINRRCPKHHKAGKPVVSSQKLRRAKYYYSKRRSS